MKTNRADYAVLGFASELNLQIFLRDYGIHLSKSFAECMDEQLAADLYRKSGIRPSVIVSISWPGSSLPDFVNSSGLVSRFSSYITVNHNWNDVIICWRSKLGRIYQMSDTDVDPNDIEFWYEGIDPLLFQKQLYPGDKLPFKLGKLPYTLTVLRLNMDCAVAITLHTEQVAAAGSLLLTIDAFIEDFNQKSEKRNRADGVVHSHRGSVTPEGGIELSIDTGFAGPVFLKKFLKMLAKHPEVAAVEVG
jgi:hypothetical protein